MASLLAYDNRALGHGAFTAGTGTWTNLNHLGAMQPQVYAQVTPATGAFSFTFQTQTAAGASVSTTSDVYALLGHTLPDGAVVTFKDGAATLGAVTVANVANRPNNAILVTTPSTFATLTVEVASAGADPVRIGSLWTSTSLRPAYGFALLPYGLTPETLAPWSRINTTIWPNSRGVVNRVTFEMGGMSRSEAHGPDMPNWSGITSLVGKDSPVIVIPDDSRLYESTYGLFGTFQQLRPEPMPQASGWRGGADVLEMR